MGIVISFQMNKGGVGKTSLVTNLASAIAKKFPEKKVLIIDTDGQGNCAMSYGLIPDKLSPTLYECLTEELPTNQAIISIRENLYLLPSNDDMNFFELDILPNLKGRNPFSFLKKVVDQIRGDYDYIIIDSPPDMKMIAGNILNVVDFVFVPFMPELYSVQGLIRVVNKIKEFQKELKVSAKIGGVICMMVNSRTNLHQGLMIQADAYCKMNGIKLFDTKIPRAVSHADAPTKYGMPVVEAIPNGKEASLYYEVMKEVLRVVSEKEVVS